MPITPAQRRLIAHLIADASRGGPELVRRWENPNAAPFAAEHAKRGRLLLMRDWTAAFVLDPEGEVWIIDTEYGKPPEPGTEKDRRLALFQGLRRFPELLSLLPARPEDAVTCSGCEGTGILPINFEVPALRGSVVCRCGGAGWVPRPDP